jgi:hypothetical protein
MIRALSGACILEIAALAPLGGDCQQCSPGVRRRVSKAFGCGNQALDCRILTMGFDFYRKRSIYPILSASAALAASKLDVDFVPSRSAINGDHFSNIGRLIAKAGLTFVDFTQAPISVAMFVKRKFLYASGGRTAVR